MTTFKGIPASQVPLDEMTYTFVEDGTGEVTHIAASSLLRALQRSGAVPMLCMMAGSLRDAIERGDLNVEEGHALALPDEALDAPCVVGEWGDKHIIIDGSHRLWRRFKRGDPDFPAYLVPEAAWRLFVIHGIPGDAALWGDFNRNAKVRS